MQKYLRAGAFLASLIPHLAGAVVNIGTVDDLATSYFKFYRPKISDSRKTRKVENIPLPLAQGTFVSLPKEADKVQTQKALIQTGIQMAREQGRPFILDGATAYNEFLGAGQGFKQALGDKSDQKDLFVMMKFREQDFSKNPPKTFERKDIDLEHFKAKYIAALNEMGISQFTVVMPHGNFFADYSDFLWVLNEVLNDPQFANQPKPGVGASNFLSEESLEKALAAADASNFSFVAVEYEKHLLCDFEGPRQFLANNPDILSLYVGVYGGKPKPNPYEFARSEMIGKDEIKKSVPQYAEALLQDDAFKGQFTNAFELAANAVIRNHYLPVVIMSSSSPDRVRENYRLQQRVITTAMDQKLKALEALGPCVRYDKGLRDEDKTRYQLVKSAL